MLDYNESCDWLYLDTFTNYGVRSCEVVTANNSMFWSEKKRERDEKNLQAFLSSSMKGCQMCDTNCHLCHMWLSVIRKNPNMKSCGRTNIGWRF